MLAHLYLDPGSLKPILIVQPENDTEAIALYAWLSNNVPIPSDMIVRHDPITKTPYPGKEPTWQKEA